MAVDINSVVVVGNLTSDMEIAYTNGGTAVGTFSIANNYRRGNENAVSYFQCKAFGKQAESLKPYLLKGKKVVVLGSCRQDRYTGKDGNNRSVVYIVAESIQLVGAPSGSSEGGFKKKEGKPVEEENEFGLQEDILFGF